MARRLLMIKSDGSVLVHSDGGSYKPLNWMSPPCWLEERDPVAAELPDSTKALWVVTNKGVRSCASPSRTWSTTPRTTSASTPDS